MLLDSKASRALGVIASCVSFVIYVVYQNKHHYKLLEASKQHHDRIATDGLQISNLLHASKYWTVITSTWPLVITYQCLWAIYSLIAIVRWKSLQITSIYFYGLWCTACCFDISSSFLATGSNLLVSWSFTCAGALARYGCLFFAFHGLFEFLAAHTGVHKRPSRFDIFCQRAILQNGLLCFQAWSSFTISVEFSFILRHVFNTSQTLAHCVSLSILCVSMIVWFVIQNFFVEKYTRYTIAEYITFVIILGMFFGQCRNQMNGTYAYSLLLLCLTVIICIFRGCLIFYSENERKSATDDELEFMT